MLANLSKRLNEVALVDSLIRKEYILWPLKVNFLKTFLEKLSINPAIKTSGLYSEYNFSSKSVSFTDPFSKIVLVFC